MNLCVFTFDFLKSYNLVGLLLPQLLTLFEIFNRNEAELPQLLLQLQDALTVIEPLLRQDVQNNIMF